MNMSEIVLSNEPRVVTPKPVRIQQDFNHLGTWLVQIWTGQRWMQMAWFNTVEEAMAEKRKLDVFYGNDPEDDLLI